MTRKSLILFGAGVLLLPLPAASQGTTGGSGSRQPITDTQSQVFLGAFQAIREFSLVPFSDSLLWDMAIEGLLKQLGDPYATVFTPEAYSEFQEGNTGNYAGIGVQITSLNDAITVTAVFRSTPAERVGMLVGDMIVGVDGEGTEGWTTGRTSDVIRGEVGSTVKVTVSRDGVSTPIELTIPRDSVHVSAVVADRIGDVGYIALDRVARSSALEVDSALTMLADTRGIILDLRGNPGGYLDESLMMSDVFLQRGLRLASLKSRTVGQVGGEASEESWNARGRARMPDVPIIVLVDAFSASAAEIVAGALQDHDRALIIGQRTFGKGIVQSDIPLTAGRHLRLTTGEWFTPLGRSLHRPRDFQGRLQPEDSASVETVTTAGGRVLRASGGIFPDLIIQNDTLKLAERELLQEVAEAQIPLALRIEEFAFAEAERLEGQEPELDEAGFERFLGTLVDEGVSKERFDDPTVRSYVAWRTKIRIAERMNRLGFAMKVRAERDPVVETAIRLLGEIQTQTELFATVEREQHQLDEVTARSGAGR